MKRFAYPLPASHSAPWRPSHVAQAVHLAKLHIQRPLFDKTKGIELHLRNPDPLRALNAEEMPVVFITHNNMRFLRSFLAHYRSLGKVRFICVDDGSTDGTLEFLLEQADADVYSSNVRFKEADRGKLWREMIFARYGFDRWYISVDSDEYLVFGTMVAESVNDYAMRLERAGIRRLPAPMLDLYPAGDFANAHFTGDDATMPWQVATHLDADGYKAQVMGSRISIYGGVRSRAFRANVEMMKYPLLRWDRFCSMGRTIHGPKPGLYNFPPVMGALLHFKIFSDIREMAATAVRGGQHYFDSKIYRAVLAKLAETDIADLSYSGSIPYRGVGDLIDRGFMRTLSPDGSGSAR